MLSWGAAEPGDPPLPPPGAVQEGGPLPLPGLQEGKEHLAPTVRTTATRFRSVAHRVITSCLRDRSVSARHRARVVEHWIPGARASRERAQEPLSSSGSFLSLENWVCSLPAGHCGCWVGRRGGVLPSQSQLSLPPRNQAPPLTACAPCFKGRAPHLPRNAVPLERSRLSGPRGCPGRQVWDSPLWPQSQRILLATLFTAVWPKLAITCELVRVSGR